MSTVVVTIKSDGSFDMITQGVPLAGVARMKKDKVTLVVKEQLGSKLPPGSNPEAIMELQEDGTVLFLEGRFDPVPMTRATEDDDKS
jgi:hypothetical protein